MHPRLPAPPPPRTIRPQFTAYGAPLYSHCSMLSRRVMEALLVSLGNGQVRLYHGKNLIHSMQLNDVAVAMRWGQFGREQNSCAFIGRNGSLTLKMMSRQANLEKGGETSGPPAEQDVPLKVPRKTKLYVEQTEREVQNAINMHRLFQRDLCKLRLTTVRSYVKVRHCGTKKRLLVHVPRDTGNEGGPAAHLFVSKLLSRKQSLRHLFVLTDNASTTNP